ncbi:MAG: hypothetical protein K9L68_13005 [Spirochaetales bacterium]|nr:hypothetical protein [Spirochaetales bacterium]
MNMEITEQIREALEDTLETAKTNRENGEPKVSLAYDSGRVAGLQQALTLCEEAEKQWN